ncbi:MAG: hypothetical protein WC631_00610 [Candidatus Paceibacterota bacterium]|jgi:hypothetical protein
MIAFKEWLKPERQDEEVKTYLKLTDRQFDRYLEIVSGSEEMPNALGEEIGEALKDAPDTDRKEIINWIVGRWVKNNIKG